MFRADAGARLPRNMASVIVWVGLGLAVRLLVAAARGRDAATDYVAAYRRIRVAEEHSGPGAMIPRKQERWPLWPIS